MNPEPFSLVHLGSLIHLALATILSLVYIRYRAVAILPAIMISSLIGVFLGLQIHPFISGISGFAAALIVFIAGLELKPEFIRRNKERVLIMFFFEATMFLTLFYLLVFFLPFSLAVTISAIMVASNEAFVIDIGRYGDKELAQYGITMSVLEDAMAVFLLSIGFFASPHIGVKETDIALLFSIIVLLIPLFYLVSGPFDRFIDRIERLDAKILLSILYLSILIATAELLGIPEAITVFIGSVSLSLRDYDPEAFKAMESYFVLALVGFVASLPYTLKDSVHQLAEPATIATIILVGTALAFIAFALRFIMLLFASTLGGLRIGRSVELAVSLANTGEFGLIVLAALIGSGVVPPWLALSAMVAYAANLSLVSFLVKHLDRVSSLLLSHARSFWSFMARIGEGADEFVHHAAQDVTLKRDVLGLSVMLIVDYVSLFIQRVVTNEVVTYMMSIVVVSSFVVAVQKFYHGFSKSFEEGRIERRYISAFMMLIRFLLLYVIVAPMISFLSVELREYRLALKLDHPLSIYLILLTIYGLSYLSDAIGKLIIHEPRKRAVRGQVRTEEIKGEGAAAPQTEH